MNRGDEESEKFFAEFTPSTSLRTGLSGVRFFASLRMTRGEGLRITNGCY